MQFFSGRLAADGGMAVGFEVNEVKFDRADQPRWLPPWWGNKKPLLAEKSNLVVEGDHDSWLMEFLLDMNMWEII